MNTFHFNDIKIGLEEKFQVKVTQEMQDSFAKLSGDYNPLHIDREFAKANGHPDVVVYGMLTASFYSRLVGMYIPGKYALFQECKVAFNLPVYVNDFLEVTGKVTEIDEVFKRITIKANIINESGKKVSKAKLVVGFVGENIYG